MTEAHPPAGRPPATRARRRRILVVVALAALPLLLLAGWNAADQWRLDQERVAAERASLAGAAARIADEFVAGQFAHAHLVAAANDVTQRGQHPRLEAALDRFLAAAPGLVALTVIDADGVVIAARTTTGLVIPPRSIRLGMGDYGRRLLAGEAALSPAYTAQPSGQTRVALGVPTTFDDGTRGVVFAALSLDRLAADLEAIRPSADAGVIVTDSDGKVFVHPDPAVVAAQAPLGERADVRAALAGGSGSQFVPGDGGQEALSGYAPAPGARWAVVVQEPATLALAEARRQALANALLIGLATALTGGLAWYLSGRLTEAQRQTDAALALLGGVFGTAPVGLAFLDPDLRFVRVNEALARLNGRPIAAHLGRRLREVVSATTAEVLEPTLRQVLTTRAPMLNVDMSGVTPGGSGATTHVLASYYPVAAGDGTLLGVGAVVVDVTALRAADEARRESEARFAVMADGSPFMIWVTDADGNIEFVNRAYQEFFGVTTEQVVGQDWQPLIHPDDAADYVASFLAALQARQPWTCQARVRRADGAWRWIESRSTPRFLADGAYAGAVGSSPDITERKAAEDAIRASAARQAFLLALSDRLRPLADPAAIQLAAARALAEHLGAGRVGYGEDQGDGETVVVTRAYANGLPSIEGRYRYDDFCTALAAAFRTGQTVVRPDIAADPTLTEAGRAALAARQIGAAVSTPLVKQGRLRAVFFVHHATARAYTPAEVTLIEEVAERTWEAAERARAGVALHDSEERLRLALTAGAMGVWDWDLESGTLTWDATQYALHGLTPGTPLTLERYLALIHPDDRARLTLFGGDEETIDEFRIVRPDGELRWITSWEHVEHDAAGTPRRKIGVNIDITARKAAEAERDRLTALASAAEARYRGLFEGVAEAILVSDGAGVYIEANAAMERLSGYTRAELLTMRAGDLAAGGRGWAMQEFAQAAADGTWRGEFELRRKDGTLVPVESLATRHELPTGAIHIGAFRDIRERRALERLRRESLAVVAHDLKTPVTGIRGLAQLMQRRGVYQDRSVANIIAQADRLARMIDDLADASLLEAGRLESRRAPVDLVDLARAAAEQAQATTERHRIQVVAPSAPVVGEWDGQRLGQVLQNLIGNAIKYAPDGGDVTVTIAQRDGEARISVMDQGIGIPADALPRLFERFYRSEAATIAADGLGLGLHICHGLVELHGGRIWAESAGPGHGSAFHVTLPLAGATPAPDVDHAAGGVPG